MEEASLSRTEKEVSLIILADRARSVCAGVCVYFVMTRLGEPVDLTVKNGENLFPLILRRKQESKPCWFWMKDVFVFKPTAVTLLWSRRIGV